MPTWRAQTERWLPSSRRRGLVQVPSASRVATKAALRVPTRVQASTARPWGSTAMTGSLAWTPRHRVAAVDHWPWSKTEICSCASVGVPVPSNVSLTQTAVICPAGVVARLMSGSWEARPMTVGSDQASPANRWATTGSANETPSTVRLRNQAAVSLPASSVTIVSSSGSATPSVTGGSQTGSSALAGALGTRATIRSAASNGPETRCGTSCASANLRICCGKPTTV